MQTIEITLLETIAWKEDPMQLCAGQPVIPAANFALLAKDAITFKQVKKTEEEIIDILKEQSKRFAACGANFSDRLGVVRKNPDTGWQYIVDLIIV